MSLRHPSSHKIQKTTILAKINLYKTVITPVVSKGYETWTTTKASK